MHSEIARVGQANGADYHFDVKALRLATHGWWLGNPLVYKPGAADLAGLARELARAGSPSGTLVLGDTGGVGSEPADAILILRLATPPETLGEIAATALAEVTAEVTRETFDLPCAVAGQWDVVMGDEAASTVVARVALDDEDGVVLLRLRLAFDALWQMGRDAGGQPITPLLTRPDWREVFLARTLHALDVRLG